jgi:peptidoglycan-N-acetylmuramic acid deacetylase
MLYFNLQTITKNINGGWKMKYVIRHLIILCTLLLCAAGTVHGQGYNSSLHWGFKKGRNGEPADAGEKLENLLERYGAYYKGDPKKKVLYLTFDNGYENGYTEKILDVLKEEKVPATFFVTGHYLESASDLVKRMVKEGHIIGNHSWYHPDMTKVSRQRFVKELETVRAETARLTKQKKMVYLRPPRGTFNERTLQLAQEQGYIHVFWSLAFIDWYVDNQKGWRYSYDSIMRQAHPGAIILLHSISKDNANALEKVIKDLKKQGYTFKSLDDLVMEKNVKEPLRPLRN